MKKKQPIHEGRKVFWPDDSGLTLNLNTGPDEDTVDTQQDKEAEEHHEVSTPAASTDHFGIIAQLPGVIVDPLFYSQ